MELLIPAENVRDLQDALTKLNKRAVKLGIAPATLTLGGTVERKDSDNPALIYVLQEVTVTGETPVLAGWKLLAAADMLDGENVIRAIGELPQGLSARLRGSDNVCEHCGHRRHRNTLYAVVHEDGREMIVGSNCLRDFTGHHNPEALAEWFTVLWGTVRSFEDDGEERLRGCRSRGLMLAEFMTTVCTVVRTSGWVSRAAASERGGISTAEEATRLLTDARYAAENAKAGVTQTDEDAELAEKVTAWARGLQGEGLSDWHHNLRIIHSGESVLWKHLGLAASAIIGYQREVEGLLRKQREQKEKSQSAHFGTKGQRMDAIVTVMNVHYVETAYGCLDIISMRTPEGNTVVWKTTAFHGLRQGQQYRVKFTVKAHDEFRGEKQTEVQRLKLLEALEATA